MGLEENSEEEGKDMEEAKAPTSGVTADTLLSGRKHLEAREVGEG